MTADAKYIVFKRDEFYQLMGELALPPYRSDPNSKTATVVGENWACAPIAEHIKRRAEETCLPDAVVIRTQDELSVAPLLVYATEARQRQLWDIAEYFTKRAMEAEAATPRLPD